MESLYKLVEKTYFLLIYHIVKINCVQQIKIMCLHSVIKLYIAL